MKTWIANKSSTFFALLHDSIGFGQSDTMLRGDQFVEGRHHLIEMQTSYKYGKEAPTALDGTHLSNAQVHCIVLQKVDVAKSYKTQ